MTASMIASLLKAPAVISGVPISASEPMRKPQRLNGKKRPSPRSSAQLLAAAGAVDHDASRQEQQRLERGVGEQVEQARRTAPRRRRAANM